MTRAFLALALAISLSACGSHAPEAEDDEEPAASPSPTTEPTVEPATDASAPSGRISRYTRINRCQQLELEEDEGGWSLQRCKGEGDYSLLVTEGDARQNMLLETPETMGKDKARSLDLSEGTSGGFSRIGDTAEWRGPAARDFKPDALVFRHFVVETPETPARETAWLLVYALRNGQPCLVARIPPTPQQSDEARTVVDGPLHCRKED